MAYLDRVNIGFAKRQMLKDLSLSDAAFATGAGVSRAEKSGCNLGGYFGSNIPIWAKHVSADKSAALYIIAAILLVGAALTFLFILKSLRVKIGS